MQAQFFFEIMGQLEKINTYAECVEFILNSLHQNWKHKQVRSLDEIAKNFHLRCMSNTERNRTSMKSANESVYRRKKLKLFKICRQSLLKLEENWQYLMAYIELERAWCEILMHPFSSSELFPLDYHLLQSLKNSLNVVNLNSIEVSFKRTCTS